MIIRRVYTINLWIATLLMLLATMLPHHHHANSLNIAKNTCVSKTSCTNNCNSDSNNKSDENCSVTQIKQALKASHKQLSHKQSLLKTIIQYVTIFHQEKNDYHTQKPSKFVIANYIILTQDFLKKNITRRGPPCYHK